MGRFICGSWSRELDTYKFVIVAGLAMISRCVLKGRLCCNKVHVRVIQMFFFYSVSFVNVIEKKKAVKRPVRQHRSQALWSLCPAV